MKLTLLAFLFAFLAIADGTALLPHRKHHRFEWLKEWHLRKHHLVAARSSSPYPWWDSTTQYPWWGSSTPSPWRTSTSYPWWQSSTNKWRTTTSYPWWGSSSPNPWGTTTSYPWWRSSTGNPWRTTSYPWWGSSTQNPWQTTTQNPWWGSSTGNPWRTTTYPWWGSSTQNPWQTTTSYPWWGSSTANPWKTTTSYPWWSTSRRQTTGYPWWTTTTRRYPSQQTTTPYPGTTTSNPSISCPSGAIASFSNNQCFKLINTNLTFIEAEEACKSNMGGHLASIHNAFDNMLLNDYARNILGSGVLYSIGANNLDNQYQWSWTDGTPFNYFDWDRNNHNGNYNNCAKVLTTHGAWKKTDCYSRAPYVCTVPPYNR